MKTRDMTRMTNQIAAYFSVFPHAEAVSGIAGHIREFWEPRMCAQLRAHAKAGGEGLPPLVMEAIAQLEEKAA